MEDTIAAISTAMGVGAISIIRVSGPEAISIVNDLFPIKKLNKMESHTIHYGFIEKENKKIDEVLVSVMKAPKTFTKEDIVEINCHGGIIPTKQILDVLLESGARLAEPGEFTKRAFLNDRIDLIKSESTMDIINAKTESAKNLALNGITGKITNLIENLRNDIFSIIGTIEVNIDYPEYTDVQELTNKDILPNINKIKEKIENVIKEGNTGQIIKNGLKLVIIGSPNVGKSSILNRLLDEEKAIVTNIAGTTRDIVEGQISLNGVLLNIIDTAGIRETEDLVEQIGVEKSLKEINTADLVLFVLDSTKIITNEEEELLSKIKTETIVIMNKQDLKPQEENIISKNVVKINTVDQNGIDPLKEKIIELFNLEKIKEKDINYLSNARQLSLMKEALKQVEQSIAGINTEKPIDLIEVDLKDAWLTLGKVIGKSYDEELIDDLFQN
jgi:tRNA modification GTPase